MGTDTHARRSARGGLGRSDSRRRPDARRCASTAGLALTFTLVLGGWASDTPASTMPVSASESSSEPLHAAGSVLQSPENPLSLSDEQRIRIGEIIALSNQFAVALKAELDDARADLKRKLDEPTPDFDAVMSDVERVGQLETQLRKHQIATLMSLRAQLSDEQRTGLMRLFQMLSRGRPRSESAIGPVATTPTSTPSPSPSPSPTAQNAERPSTPKP